MPQTTDEYDVIKMSGKPRNYQRRSCPSSTIATKNRTCTALGLNPEVRAEKSAATMAQPSITHCALLFCLRVSSFCRSNRRRRKAK